MNFYVPPTAIKMRGIVSPIYFVAWEILLLSKLLACTTLDAIFFPVHVLNPFLNPLLTSYILSQYLPFMEKSEFNMLPQSSMTDIYPQNNAGSVSFTLSYQNCSASPNKNDAFPCEINTLYLTLEIWLTHKV